MTFFWQFSLFGNYKLYFDNEKRDKILKTVRVLDF